MRACLYPQEGELCSMTPSQTERQAGRVALPFPARPEDPEVQGVTRPREASG